MYTYTLVAVEFNINDDIELLLKSLKANVTYKRSHSEEMEGDRP